MTLYIKIDGSFYPQCETFDLLRVLIILGIIEMSEISDGY